MSDSTFSRERERGGGALMAGTEIHAGGQGVRAVENCNKGTCKFSCERS